MTHGQLDWTGGLGPQPLAGDRVGRYRLESLVGTGGLASVYRAVDTEGPADAPPVAVKILNPSRVLTEEIRRFTREFRALARMEHENIVRVYEAGVHGGYPWLAMEFVDGCDLDTEIARWRTDPPEDRWERVGTILRGMCRGLAYVHDLGLIHRDLKPSNVLLTKDGVPKISDFGVVKGTENTQTTNLTAAGRLVGTVAFMAPELITDERVDKRADLYALGAVLYLMGTQRRPIEADSVAGYLARHLTEVPAPMSQLEPSVPSVLERIAARLLQKDPVCRHPSAQAVLQALDRPEDPDLPPLRGRDEVIDQFNTTLRRVMQGERALIGLVGPVGSGRSHLLQVLTEQAVGIGVPLVQPSGLDHPSSEATPALLPIDDLDRADAKLVAKIARRLKDQPLLVLFTAEDTDGGVFSLVDGIASDDRPPLVRFALGPVDSKAVLALLRDRGVTGPVATVLARRLHAEHAGMPGPMVRQLDALVTEGWLVQSGDALRAARPLDDFRKADLPVPDAIRQRILARLERVDDASRELCELVALLDRPTAPALLEWCRPEDKETPRLVDVLVREGAFVRAEVDGQEQVALPDPCTARVVRAEIAPERRRALHARLAESLASRKRRVDALEVARHLRAAGDEATAYPWYLQAMQRAAREGRHSEVLETVPDAEAVRVAGEGRLPPGERLQMQRWRYLLHGEALLARRAWAEATGPLEAATRTAREEGDPVAIGRTSTSLARALYRSGRFADAEPLLRAALQASRPDAPERAVATRALADIALRDGRLEEAEGLLGEALRAADASGSADAEARARRSLAHLRAVQGRLENAAELLAHADDLLNPDGDYQVRAGVLARALELDLAAGRAGRAWFRAEALVDLARRHGLGERLPEAYALLAELRIQLGQTEEANDAASQALVFANATPTLSWDQRMRLSRALADLGRTADATEALPRVDLLPSHPNLPWGLRTPDGSPPPGGVLDEPHGQRDALRARLTKDPQEAYDLAQAALARRPPLLVLAAVAIHRDAARALLAIGQTDAAASAIRTALERARAADAPRELRGPGPTDGLRLALLLTLVAAAPGDPALAEIRDLVGRRLPILPPTAVDTFLARRGIAEALRS